MSTSKDRIKAAQAESEATRDEPYPAGATGKRPGRARSVVQSVRLPTEDYAAIEALARASETPVGALIRSWVLAGLAAERSGTLVDALDRLIADAERVRRLAGGPGRAA